MKKVAEPIKAYKGFDKNLKCRGFQYEIGKEYELPEGQHPSACNNGFHACPNPNDLFAFYSPNEGNRYCLVELSGEIDDSEIDKIAASHIRIVKELTIMEVANSRKNYTEEHCTNEKNAEPGKPATAGYRGAATAGYRGAATAGDQGAATAGDQGAATAGYRGAATAGYRGAATAGDQGAATAGDQGAATAGYRGAATSRGKTKVGANGVATVRGNNVMVCGGLGAILVIAEEKDNNYDIKDWKAVVVDGKKVKADTWYKLVDGELTEIDMKGGEELW